MTTDARAKTRFAAVAAGMPVDMEQEYRENGWAKPITPDRAIPGEQVVIPDGAQSVGGLEAAQGVENPKDATPSRAISQAGALAALSALNHGLQTKLRSQHVVR